MTSRLDDAVAEGDPSVFIMRPQDFGVTNFYSYVVVKAGQDPKTTGSCQRDCV
jgi:hypothetical protein